MDTKWVKSNRHVFTNIFIAHEKELEIHSTFTNMERSNLGEPEIMTAYSLKGSEHGLIKVIERFEQNKRRETAEFRYYIGYGVSED